MGPAINFFLALAVAATSLAGGSLAWPRFTSQPRPKLLDDVHNIVLATPQGKEAAVVLGVSDEKHIQPINMGQMVGGVVTSAKNALMQRVTTVVVTNAVNQLRAQFDKLSPDKQAEVRQIICEPAAKSSSSSSSVVQ